MSAKKLQELVREEYGKRNLEKLEIPSYISENLNKQLREYQKEALKFYFAQRELHNEKSEASGNHLMFNMATGSGKTLIMAALMLECFKNGYRNFIFFVNSNAILEKTKANFSDKNSKKYLFNDEILIDTQRVEINIIKNLNESKKESINIYFTTIQSLFSVLTKEQENVLSFLDFKEAKIVFLADEAHHLNSETKKASKKESENKENWETIVKKAYEANNENLMLEFSATIPKEREVTEKYNDKIIYEYALKEFCENGFSKRIYLLKYDDKALKSRFLGGILASLYREFLAVKYEIALKPVILFKSPSISQSKDNEKMFLDFLENLQSADIEQFYKNYQSAKGEVLSDSFVFFKNKFKENYALKLVRFIKTAFKKSYILNANDEKEAKEYQILLNSLEESENHIRVIFAVNKLDEGWDVLNLFDIVRLNDKANSKKTTTTSEVQLIGRGARYYPFMQKEFEEKKAFKRKFDNDLNNELSHLERLNYHTLNDVSFIENLNKEMREQGLFIEELTKKKCELKLTPYAQEIKKNYKMFYAKNQIKRRELSIFDTRKITEDEVKQEMELIEIPLFSKHINESLVDFKESEIKIEDFKHTTFKDGNFSYECFLKALNRLQMDFNSLKAFKDVESKKDFYEKMFYELNVKFHKKQDLSKENQVEIFIFVLDKLKNLVYKKKKEIEVSEFQAYELKLDERVVFKDKIKQPNYEWLYFDKVPYDSELELEFLRFIEGEKEKINQKFSEWVVVRNEGFKEFKIYYDYRKDKDNYGKGFEPDFIFFAKEKNSENFFALQCFMEVKGTHLVENDQWKEDLLQVLKGKFFDTILNEKGYKIDKANLKLESLPFFTGENKTPFLEAFRKIFH